MAALAALAEVGAEPGPLKEALAGFQGVHKRQEVAGEFQGVLVLQDFAHHPTAVAVTLAAVRQGYPDRRLVAVFEPRTNTSRRRIFQEPYAAGLPGRRPHPGAGAAGPVEGGAGGTVFLPATGGGPGARRENQPLYFPDTDQLLAGLLPRLQPGDLVLVMSNGDFDHLVPRLCEALGGD